MQILCDLSILFIVPGRKGLLPSILECYQFFLSALQLVFGGFYVFTTFLGLWDLFYDQYLHVNDLNQFVEVL